MKYFLDTEFLEDGPEKPIYPLAIGIVAEDGREFYSQPLWIHQAIDLGTIVLSDWLKENVVPHLTIVGPWHTRTGMQSDLLEFCDVEKYGKPEFWAYYADYDWVVLCQLFGRMIDLPKGWPMYCNDLKQLAVSMGNPKLPPMPKGNCLACNHPAGNHAQGKVCDCHNCIKFLPNVAHNALSDAREVQYRYNWLHMYANTNRA